MTDSEFNELAHAIAGHLSTRRGEQWEAREGERGFGTDIHNAADGLTVSLQTVNEGERVYAQGMYPSSRKTPAQFDIRVAAVRGPRAIAAEIDRRLLPGYARELRAVLAFEQREEEEYDARVAAVHEIEALFGARTEFGPYGPHDRASGRYQDSYRTEARLPVRGKFTRPGQRYPDTEHARFAVDHGAELASLEISGVPLAVVRRMAKVLADYTALLPGKAECCEMYGSPHPAKYCRPECPQGGTDSLPEPRPFSDDFELLYDLWLSSGDFQRISWTDWLKSRAV